MTSAIRVLAVVDRESQIEHAALTGRLIKIRFRGALIDLGEKRVPIGVPIYRMRNIRTGTRQRQWAKGHARNYSDFLNGQEDQTLQTVQHEFLVELSKANAADIYERLQRDAEQSEAIIITAKGVVLNGNRRLAAMRELFAADAERFRRFEHVDVAVLPADATEDDLSGLETDLQIAPELKLDYDWINEILTGLRYQTAAIDAGGLGWDMTKASSHWGQTPKQLRIKLSALDAAEAFLRYVSEPENYDRVMGDEQAFSTFTEKRQGAASDPSAREAEQWVFFTVLANKVAAGTRVYEAVTKLPAITAEVVKQADQVAAADPPSTAGDDPLMAVAAATATVRHGVLLYLADLSNAVTVSTWAIAALDAIRNASRAQRKATGFLTSATQINAATTGLGLNGAQVSTIGPAATQLVKALLAIAEKLQEVLAAHPNEVKGAMDASDLALAVSKLEDVRDKIGQP